MSVFLLQFLMKIADRLIGKGLSFIVISKLVIYSLSWMFVLSVPMAVLVAALMAFGNMAQNNEIAIMKATGISLYKMMVPPLLASVVVALLLIQFNNHVYPNANHELRVLMEDISRQKPMISLVPGVFSQEIRHYSILAREIDAKSNTLEDIVIYDHSNPRELNIITARKGIIYLSKNQKKLILDLQDGEIHTSERRNPNEYRKMIFKKYKLAMDASQFVFSESRIDNRRSDRELGAPVMLTIVDSLKKISQTLDKELKQAITTNTYSPRYSNLRSKNIKNLKLKLAYLRAADKLNASRNKVLGLIRRIKNNNTRIGNYWVEIHKKYAIPVACIVFILIGVPLGTMTRKGGIGMASAISLIFFLVYWAFLIGGEKLADRGLLSPFWGVWSANIFLGLLGIILTVKSAKERITLSFEFLYKLVPKNWRMRSENT